MKKILFTLVALLTTASAFADNWEKTSTVAVGDVVVLAVDNGSVTKELSTVTTSGTTIGQVVDFTDTPEGVYPLTIVAGNADGSFAFKNSDGNYLAWSSGNSLTVSETLDDAASWTLTYTNDKWDINNVGTPARKLQYNASSPRFACYTSNQTAVDLWKQIAGAVIAKPTLPASTTFLGSMEVAITAGDGLEIHYTTDGTDPTTASSTYTDALTITETTTVKAIAVDVTGASSGVASATYTKLASYATIAELTALENNAPFVFSGEALIVAKPTAKHVYISDQTGACLVYDASGEKTSNAEVGKTIAANWAGKVSIYNKLFELVPDEAIAVKDGDAISVSYPTVTTADITAENINKVVTLKGITSYSVNNKNISIVVGDQNVVGYNQFGLEIAAAEDGKTYEIVGAISRYNDNIQFQPIEIKEAVEPDPSAVIVNAEFDPAAAPIGWTEVLSGEYRDIGMYQIGGEASVRFAAPTVDDTHLATEYAAGFECRWQTNFSAYTQTTSELPAGFYKLTFDVENVNDGTTAADYDNRFTVTVGENVFTDESTEWMKGKSAWTTHTIFFEVPADSPVTISLGYGTGSNNIGANNTPAIYVSHLSLDTFDPLEEGRAQLIDEIDAAQELLGTAQFDAGKTDLQAAIRTASAALSDATTAEELAAAKTALKQAEDAFAVAQEQAPYEDALAAIGDGGTYFISTDVEGTTYYVTSNGKLTSVRADGCIFTLTKTDGGAFKTYGYYIDGGGTRFTNAPLSNSKAVLNVGNYSTSTNNRKDWEAQVLFVKDGKYAIRATNAAYGTSSWQDAGRVFFTWKVEDVVVPQYTYDQVYQWNLEAATPITVSYQLQESDGTPVGDPVTKKQEANSEISIPTSFTSVIFYDYTVSGTIGDADCTITVTRTFKAGVVHALTDLSNAKAYTIYCDRGAFLTKDGYLASTHHSSLSNAAAADFAVISYEDNFYLYSVADKKFVQNNGALSKMPMNGVFDAIQMEAKTDPYFFTYFKISESTSYGLNTNGNDPYGYVINSWMNADPGNLYYMIESSDFDATEALAALDAYFHPSFFVTYVVKDAEGQTLYTSDPVPTTSGAQITTLPADFQRPFMTYNEIDETIADEQTTVEFTATWAGPFELSTSVADAKWYNMTIRGDYWVAKDETEPYYPKADKDLSAPESQWAFGGDVYNGIVIFNKAAGEGWTLTKDGSNVVMREGEYAWEIFANSDGFVLREPGTENNWINQNGGASGPLQFWNSGNGKTDNGSTFRVTEVIEEVVTPGDADGDGSIDVVDHAVIRNYILDNEQPAYVKKYDANGDQSIDVGDLTAVVNLILYGTVEGPSSDTGVRGEASADVLTLNYVSAGRYALNLRSGRAYNAFQMDLDIPEGMTLVSEESAGHEVMTRRLANGKTRVLVFSMNNATFEGSELLFLNVAGQGTLKAENIIFSDLNANAVCMILGDATGINGLGQDARINDAYDLSGRKVEKLQRGVYIVNGKKVAVK